ncbi:hypothetical protein JOD54_004214 [Actinokineospora baliensis]|uniref:CHAT domain-containing protein n=1 Tax=Actinokineospora baliensis TaxID=547056 RepID=UPI0019560AE8|nr:CHAT domain-containing protein [Actinokineospora baliensis]MBM7774010.1 hypothetical protein [Actinokineospora baliensis]
MRELSSTVTIDHTNRLHWLPTTDYNRERSIHLRVLNANGRYFMQAWGSAFPQDGGGSYAGWITTDVATIQGGIADLRQAWQQAVIDRTEPGRRPVRRPFVDDWDLAGPDDRTYLEHAGLALARAGYALFSLLFLNGDDAMREITARIVAAVRSGEQVITVESDDLFAPWGMLYVPAAEDDDIWAADYRWVPEGFWGYQHLLEHNFSRALAFDSRVTIAGTPHVGLNVDERVDSDHPPTPCVRPIIDFFSAHTDTTVRRTKSALAQALNSKEFADDIIYFGCHGTVDGIGERPYLALGDGEKIYSSEVVAWLTNNPLATRPVVFIGACQGGQLASMFYPSFGHHLLQRGARCLIGPQIDLPRAFAPEYATQLFTEFLRHQRLGDTVRYLARMFLDRYHNPLGLIFSLYRGIDVHLGPPE